MNPVASYGVDPADLRVHYDSLDVVDVPLTVAEERTVPIAIARGPRTTLQALWPSLAGQDR